MTTREALTVLWRLQNTAKFPEETEALALAIRALEEPAALRRSLDEALNRGDGSYKP